jgi:hypothetical protein
VILRTPSQTRAALAYVLCNARKHREDLADGEPDPYSSAWYFDGFSDDAWRERAIPPDNPDGPPVTTAVTWLLRVGWRRCRLISPGEVPRG